MTVTEILRRLITSADRRMTIDQIKAHHFFYGVDWNTIRQIDAPFVPHLKSITDTSYFPTDELGKLFGKQSYRLLSLRHHRSSAFRGQQFERS